MHFTGTVYRSPYYAGLPMLEVTQGCTHNKRKFCTMYRDVPFRMSPLEWVEEDLKELSAYCPNTDFLQWIGADPFAMSFNRLKVLAEMCNKYLPNLKDISMAARMDNIFNKTVEELKELKKLHITEVVIGVESGDEWTLQRINKGYHADQIVDAIKKLDEAGIRYWMTYLNGVAGSAHSKEHAIHTAEVFNQLNPKYVGIAGLVLFTGTPLLAEAQEGKFDPSTEKEMLEELKLFYEHLNLNAGIHTGHTVNVNFRKFDGRPFLEHKEEILNLVQYSIDHIDEDYLAAIRRNKRTL